MVKKKREELSQDISYFKEQFQDINRGIQLPESLKAENLLEKLEQQLQDAEKPAVQARKLFFAPPKWAAACALILMVGLTSVGLFYRNQSSMTGTGILSQDSTSADSAPQMAAYGIDMENAEDSGVMANEGAAAPEAALAEDGMGKGMGRSMPAPAATEEVAEEAELQESIKEEIPSLETENPAEKPNPTGSCVIPQPIYATSTDEIKTAIKNSIAYAKKDAQQDVIISDQLQEKGLQTGEAFQISGTDVINYDSTTCVINFLSQEGKTLSSLKVEPGSAVFGGENALSVLWQSQDAVHVTLYEASNAAAPKEIQKWSQDGEFVNISQSGSTFRLETRINVNQTLLDENRFIPQVGSKPIDPSNIEMLYGTSQPTQYYVTTNFSVDDRQSNALLSLY